MTHPADLKRIRQVAKAKSEEEPPSLREPKQRWLYRALAEGQCRSGEHETLGSGAETRPA